MEEEQNNINDNVATDAGEDRDSNLFKNRSFQLLWASGLLCSLAFSIFFLTQSWYVVDELKTPHFLGPILMVTAIPRIFMMIIGGVVADYYRRSSILFITNILQALVACGIVFFLRMDSLSAVALLFFAFLFGFLDAFFWPAGNAMLPSLIKPHELVRANSLIQGSNQLAFIVGPMIAGFILVRYGNNYVIPFLVVAILIFLGAILIHPRLIKDPFVEKKKEYRVMADLKEGIKYIRNIPILLYCTLVAVILNLFIFGSLIISFPLFVDYLGGTALHLSYLETSFAAGSFLAGLILAILNPSKKRGRLILYSLFAASLLLILFSRITDINQGIIIAGVIGLAAFAIIIPIMSLVQENTDSSKLGRVTGIITIAFMGLEPLTYALISAALYLGISFTLVILFCGILATAATTWFLFKHHGTDKILNVD